MRFFLVSFRPRHHPAHCRQSLEKNTQSKRGCCDFIAKQPKTEINRSTAQICKLTQVMYFHFDEHENKPFHSLHHECFSYRDMNHLCRLAVLWFGGWFWHFSSNKRTTTKTTKTSCLVGPWRTRARSSSSRRAAVTVSHLPAQVIQTAEM